MKDRSGDEVSNSAGSVVAARQPRLGLLRTPYGDSTRPNQARPDFAQFCMLFSLLRRYYFILYVILYFCLGLGAQ